MIFKSLILAASLAQAALATPVARLHPRQSPHIVFDTKSLTIEDANFGSEIAVSLASAPSGVATVYLEAP
ncbi:hypothetical protein HDU67_008818, partial [Dinochytrium kinnereticum]